MKTYRNIQDLELRGKRVFLRVDFNVPLKDAGDGVFEVSDDARIRGALKTIEYIVEKEGKCILASHLGRPDGVVKKKFSLEPVAKKLSELLNRDVTLSEDSVGDGPRALSQRMRPGEILLLENLRFHPGEEKNAVEFANQLRELCDIYVNDAFGTLHRAHASTSALPKQVPDKAIGLLVQREIAYLQPLREAPKRPLVLCMGGSKVSDKIGVLEYFLDKVDTIIIGGAMAYAFLRAKGHSIGKSYCDFSQVTIADRLIKSAEVRGVRIQLPVDHVVARAIDNPTSSFTTENAEIPDPFMGVDVGPKSIELFGEALKGAATILWNGPMGVFEVPAFSAGTFALAKLIAASSGQKLAGGGDSAAAIAESGVEAQFDFISTGGGATLEYLEGKDLPGLKVLEIGTRS